MSAPVIAPPRRRAQTFGIVALTHRWLGLTLFVVCLGGTLWTMPALAHGTLIDRFIGVLALEAGGGGPVNEPPVIALIVSVAALGVVLLVHGLAHARGLLRMPRSAAGWVRLVHRWLGAAFTLSLVAYLALRASGAAPGAVGWAWVALLLAVNALGFVLFGVRLAGRRPRRRPRAPRG